VLLMDEPFSAIDPIARGRLQDEFLRVQGEVRKTILFVTHDIDEAVRLGDRVAVFRQGGLLEQYDTPARILGAPASEFVADFVGGDRGLRRLAVTPVDADCLVHPPVVAAGTATADLPGAMGDSDWAVVLDDQRLVGAVSREHLDGARAGDAASPPAGTVEPGSTLKDALALMLRSDAAWVAVVDGGRYVGALTPRSLHAALRRSVDAEGDAAGPAAGAVDGPADGPRA
jgi:osmoprotectant transport system ATP-binding protein